MSSVENGIDRIMKLSNSIVNQGVFPADWEVSSIVNSYKGKVDALERCRGVILLGRVMKVIESVQVRLECSRDYQQNL